MSLPDGGPLQEGTSSGARPPTGLRWARDGGEAGPGGSRACSEKGLGQVSCTEGTRKDQLEGDGNAEGEGVKGLQKR